MRTDEEDLVAEVKGRRLFELDRHRLAELSGMLAILHGPSLDDGVCMELGYAAALTVPIVILTTDFITHGPTDDGPELVFPDPLIETLATETVRTEKLGPSESSHGNRFDDFRHRNVSQIAEATDLAVDRLLTLATGGPIRKLPNAEAGQGRTVFCEPCPYWTDPSWTSVRHELSPLGNDVRTAERLSAPDPTTAATKSTASGTHHRRSW